jgi:hypothetical protein
MADLLFDLLFIVSRTEPKTYTEIRDVFATKTGRGVILDRRGRERRHGRRQCRPRDATRAAPSGRDVGSAIIRLGRGEAREGR